MLNKHCLSKYLGFLNDTAYPISSDSGERVISDVISAHCVHWTNGRPMDMSENIKDDHPCLSGSVDTLCPFVFSIGHFNWAQWTSI